MVPAAILTLDALPVTANGKLDRRALPAPGAEPRAAEGRRAPRTSAEEALTGIWMEVLGLPQVGVDAAPGDLSGYVRVASDGVLRMRVAGPPGPHTAGDLVTAWALSRCCRPWCRRCRRSRCHRNRR